MRLVDADQLRPSTYNPRQADPERLGLVELSLRKLGWLLPVYASSTGEVLSGHQRHLVATERIGCRQLPAVFVGDMDLQQRKAINVVFNRATNDLDRGDTPATLTDAIHQSGILELAAGLPDLEPDTEAFYPCLQYRDVPIAPLLKANRGRWINYARNIASTLDRRGIRMPVVVGPGWDVINGIGRLQLAAERRRTTIRVVDVPEEKVAFARAMLNLLSMDFDLATRYEDLLRYNSFRRARRTRSRFGQPVLGRGFLFAVIGSKQAYSFDIRKPGHMKRWVRQHGSTIIDFGAGHLHETDLLRSVGIDVTPFEPYHLGEDNEIDKHASVGMTRAFLHHVAAGKSWSSIFIASVLNSVPFLDDRRHIVTLVAALASRDTGVYACASSTDSQGWININGADRLDPRASKTIQFKLDYESGIAVGDVATKPKVQKYHTQVEFHRLFAERFLRVAISEQVNNIQAVCSRPRKVDEQALREAIAFEFDLPYPDGSRMGLVREALDAFSHRLHTSL